MNTIKYAHGVIVMYLMAWAILFGLLTYLFSRYEARQQQPNTIVKSYDSTTGQPIIRLQANKQHHYIMPGKINGQPVTFLLDTGATDVVIPGQLARRLKLKRGFPLQARTASHVITVYRTKIDRLQLGDFSLPDIRATINPRMPGHEVLLGMSVLKLFELRQRDGELVLTWPAS